MSREEWQIRQEKLLKYIALYIDGDRLSNILIKKLGISRTSAYKRIRCETALTIDDLAKLKEILNFSLDQFFLSNYAPTSFQFDALNTAHQSPHDFLVNVSHHMRRLTRGKNVSYLYLSNEVPLYHLLQFPLLAKFKLYVWNILNWQISINNEDQFTPDTYSNITDWQDTANNLQKMYFDYSGKEIWNTLFLDPTIEQINYMFMSGKISYEVGLKLYDNLLDLKSLLNNFAEKGLKYIKDDPNQSSANTKFYFTQVVSGSEIIYVKSDRQSTILTGFDTPNLMGSIDSRLVNYSEKYINNILFHSINITKENLIQRKQFFSGLTKKINTGRIHLERINEIY